MSDNAGNENKEPITINEEELKNALEKTSGYDNERVKSALTKLIEEKLIGEKKSGNLKYSLSNVPKKTLGNSTEPATLFKRSLFSWNKRFSLIQNLLISFNIFSSLFSFSKITLFFNIIFLYSLKFEHLNFSEVNW